MAATENDIVMLSSIQKMVVDVSRAVQTLHQSAEPVESRTEQTGTALATQLDIMDMSTHIATAIEQQSSVAKEVNHNLHNIQDIAQTSTERAIQNRQAAHQVAEEAANLERAVSEFKS
ncbi:hypothetical protein BZG77_06805 [Salinivibrio sp. IB643]|nr:hypothetical protein BZG77_06805 [Salinivibrio sp. IB643]